MNDDTLLAWVSSQGEKDIGIYATLDECPRSLWVRPERVTRQQFDHYRKLFGQPESERAL